MALTLQIAAGIVLAVLVLRFWRPILLGAAAVLAAGLVLGLLASLWWLKSNDGAERIHELPPWVAVFVAIVALWVFAVSRPEGAWGHWYEQQIVQSSAAQWWRNRRRRKP